VIRTLVVDDNRSFVTAATEVVLAADGFELAGVVQSGEEAVEFARVGRPDLALIDFKRAVAGQAHGALEPGAAESATRGSPRSVDDHERPPGGRPVPVCVGEANRKPIGTGLQPIRVDVEPEEVAAGHVVIDAVGEGGAVLVGAGPVDLPEEPLSRLCMAEVDSDPPGSAGLSAEQSPFD
jgi:DNA-binding NarL/FixJ family response regulator